MPRTSVFLLRRAPAGASTTRRVKSSSRSQCLHAGDSVRSEHRDQLDADGELMLRAPMQAALAVAGLAVLTSCQSSGNSSKVSGRTSPSPSATGAAATLSPSVSTSPAPSVSTSASPSAGCLPGQRLAANWAECPGLMTWTVLIEAELPPPKMYAAPDSRAPLESWTGRARVPSEVTTPLAGSLAQVAPAQRSAGDRREDAEVESASQEHDHSDYGEGHAQRVADDQ
jgi:hypothetical protein